MYQGFETFFVPMNVSIALKEVFYARSRRKNSKKSLTFGKPEWKSKLDKEIKVENI